MLNKIEELSGGKLFLLILFFIVLLVVLVAILGVCVWGGAEIYNNLGIGAHIPYCVLLFCIFKGTGGGTTA